MKSAKILKLVLDCQRETDVRKKNIKFVKVYNACAWIIDGIVKSYSKKYNMEYADIKQEAMIVLHNCINHYDESKKAIFNTYLRSSIEYYLNRYLRAHLTDINVVGSHLVGGLDFFADRIDFSTTDDVDRLEKELFNPNAIEKVVGMLTKDIHKKIITLKFVEDKTLVEIAELLDVSKQSVHQMYHRIIDKVREEWRVV